MPSSRFVLQLLSLGHEVICYVNSFCYFSICNQVFSIMPAFGIRHCPIPRKMRNRQKTRNDRSFTLIRSRVNENIQFFGPYIISCSAPLNIFNSRESHHRRGMTSNWEEFYSKAPKPINYEKDVEKIKKFVSQHCECKRKIALVTSGGTTVPLEHNTVRFVDNFSAGGRGSASAEFLLDYGYVVIFLFRLKSLEPFVRHFTGYTFLDALEIKTNKSSSKVIQVKDDKVEGILPVLQKYYTAKSSGYFLSIPFTTLADYLWLLRACCECLSACEAKALLYLAAAVSDFYIPNEKLPVHKIQSNEGPLNISLQLVPKVLKPLVSSWVPKAFIVSFKLETDDAVLITKARDALKKYNHHLVIANILNTRKCKVTFVTKYNNYDITLSPEELLKGIEIESKIINDLAGKHEEFLQASSS